MFKAAGLVSVFALHAAIASAALLPTPAPAGSSVGGLQKRAIQDDDWEEIRLIVNSQASRAIAKTYSGEPKVDGFSLGSAVLQTTSQLHQAGTISQGASFGRDFPLLIDVPDNIVTEAVLDVLPQGVAQLSERERVPALNRLLTYALLRFPWPTRHNEWFDIQDEDLQRAFEKALNAAFRDDFPPYAHQHGLPQRRLEDSMRKLGWFLGWFASEVIDIGVDRLSREVPDVLKVLDPDMMAVLYLYLGFVHGYGNCKTSDSNRYIKLRYKHTRGRVTSQLRGSLRARRALAELKVFINKKQELIKILTL